MEGARERSLRPADRPNHKEHAMSSEPISAISGNYSGDPLKRFSSTTAIDRVDLDAIAPASTGAYVHVAPKPALDPAASSMNVQNLHTVVAEGMQNGFVRKQLAAVSDKIVAMDQPGSNISTAEMHRDLMDVSNRLFTADAFSKAATKFSESVMTVVKG
jgi:hypothetical protein